MEQQNQNIQYTFATVENFNKAFNDRFLICPQCNERLKQMDIENYSKCPYCNYNFTVGGRGCFFCNDDVAVENAAFNHTVTSNLKGK